jgi:hypothetical protein
MTFNNTTNKDGILQDCEFWLFSSNYGQITNDTNLLKTFTALSNRALDSVVTTVFESDDRWEFDDTTYTDYPIATTDLFNSQRDYVLSVSHLKVTRVEAKDDQGDWYKLKPIDLVDIQQARDEFMKEDGQPMYYDKIANSVFIYPASNYDSTGGLRVYYQREPNYFLSTDTTKEPGFSSILHRLIPLKACYDYAVANNLTDKITTLNNAILVKTEELKKFYGRRNKDEVLKIIPRDTPAF